MDIKYKQYVLRWNGMAIRINLVEDEKSLNDVLTSYLVKEGWDVKPFHDGTSAMEKVEDRPDLWVLDIMLPGVDGYELIKEIKNCNPDIPVIFISARDKDIDRVVGLEMGSDDYLGKPFLPRELVIRIKKILERNQKKRSEPYNIPPYRIDEDRRTVLYVEPGKDDSKIELTSMEFDLLLLFVKSGGKPFSREQILNHIWGYDYYGNDRAVDDLVRRLRKKMPYFKIETLYGYGYKSVKV